jgi:hypothetical protein
MNLCHITVTEVFDRVQFELCNIKDDIRKTKIAQIKANPKLSYQ